MADFTINENDKRIILALSSPRTYRENSLTMIREIQKKGMRIIAICVNQPAEFLIEYYTKNGVDTNRIFFIDAITRFATGRGGESPGNCMFVPRPNDLTAMGMAITRMLKESEQEKTVIFLDSVNAMLVHSSSVDLTKFIHFVISKLRIMNITGILLAVEKGLDPVLLTQISTFADELVEFSDETAR